MSNNMDLQSVPKANIEYNNFNLSHRHATTFSMGRLYPILNMEVLPGDIFDIDIRAFLRFAPLVSPVMNKYDIIIDTYYVPYRILWDNWTDFITGKEEVTAPFMRYTGPFPAGSPTIKSLGDYMGISTDINTSGVEISALPMAAYWKIFDDYYKDQNLTIFPGDFEGLLDGNNDYVANLSKLPAFRRAWTHDYFTSALPWAQRGEPVQLPLIAGDAAWIAVTRQQNATPNFMVAGTPGTPAVGAVTGAAVTGALNVGGVGSNIDPNGSLIVELGSNAATIRDLRTAFALQSYLERSAVGGQRYREWLYANFGVIDDNAALQRPEFLGRSTGVVTVSEVLQSVASFETGPLGNMGGHGISITKENNIRYMAKEHGVIISLINVQPEAIYFQGIPKMWSRKTPLDWYLEPFARIGEQEIKVKELYTFGLTLAEYEETFGYQLRYAEYKSMTHRISGDFKDSLKFWVGPRTFGSKPLLNQEFIECNPTNDIFAVTNTTDKIYSQLLFNIKALRKMPIEGTPPIM